jgi:hypothetical protein
MPVPENLWSPGADKVDVPVSVDVPNERTVAAINHSRLAPNAAKSASWAVHAAGDDPGGPLELAMTAIRSHRNQTTPDSGNLFLEKPWTQSLLNIGSKAHENLNKNARTSRQRGFSPSLQRVQRL